LNEKHRGKLSAQSDWDNYPIVIFEYRDGTQAMKLQDQDDGLPLFFVQSHSFE